MSFIQVQIRRGTATQWTTANPVLASGELGIEIDTTLFKIGDGSTAWNSLAYHKVQWTDILNTPSGIISSSVQFNNLSSPFTGSFTGSLSGIATSASYAEISENGFPYSGSAVITGSLTVSGSGIDITGATSMQAILEKATVSATAASGSINYDVSSRVVLYYTSNSTANWTLNFRGNSATSLNTFMTTGQTLTVVFVVTNGSPAYYPTAHQIDGTSVVPKWQGGVVPTSGNVNSVDIYTYTIIKTGNATFTVFASQVMFA